MKTKAVALIASGLIIAGVWGYSQQMGAQNMQMCPWMTQSQAPARAAAKKNPVLADAASIKRGKAVYISQCASCHGYSGKGNGVDLTNLQQSDGELFWKITQGQNQMPSFAATLTERQRWDVVNYLRILGK